MDKNDFRKYIAEFTGTFVLVLFGCGSAVAANTMFTLLGSGIPLAFTTLTISAAFGLAIVAMAYSIGNVSGCHINPAVSVGYFVAGRMTKKDLAGYIIAQFAGGLAGAFVLSMVIGTRASLGQNGYGSASVLGINAGIAALIEIILTFVFVMVILCVTSKPENRSVSGLVIGLTLMLIHIFGIPFTGTSVNPARSFGPAVLAGGDALKQLPVFIIAPLIGGVLAALFCTFVLGTENEEAAQDEETEEDPDGAPETYEDALTSEEDASASVAETSYQASPEMPTVCSEGTASPSGYDPKGEMIIDSTPESVAEAEAEVIEEADGDAIV